jgi:hypothetical protein
MDGRGVNHVTKLVTIFGLSCDVHYCPNPTQLPAVHSDLLIKWPTDGEDLAIADIHVDKLNITIRTASLLTRIVHLSPVAAHTLLQ